MKGLPVGRFIKAESVRINKNGTIDVVFPGRKKNPKRKKRTPNKRKAKKNTKRSSKKKVNRRKR